VTGRSAKLTGSRFQCWHCRRHYSGERAFARHRVDLQCLEPDAMLEAGLTLTANGFWTLSAPRRSIVAEMHEAAP
jgi:hypothetical protein